MSDKILSVVIPAYNVERVIEKCISSIISAGCGEDIEILAVNDGSSDNTEAVISRWCGRYPDTVRLINKKNGGHGSAINAGISNAIGKYFKVIDGDDWVLKDGFGRLVELLKKCGSDAVGTDFYYVDERTGEKRADRCIKNAAAVKPGLEYRFDAVADSVLLQMHSLTIKTEVLRANNIKIDEKCFYVDVEYILLPVPYIKTITLTDFFVYMYRVGQLNQSVNMKNMQDRREQHRRVMTRMTEFLNEQDGRISDGKYRYIFSRLQDMLYMQYKIYLTMKGAKAEFISFDKFIGENNRNMYRSLFDQTRNKRMTASAIRIMRATGYVTYGLFNRMYCKNLQYIAKEK